MESTDPATGQPLPADAIQRVLFVSGTVHVYNIPPLASTKGYMAATWTEDPKRHIFTARLRLIETALPSGGGAAAGDGNSSGDEEQIKTDLILEDPKTGALFAAAPYTAAAAVEPTLDSSRFFALRVQDGAGRRAILGIGFEERPEAFDFSVALQEARKTLGLDGGGGGGDSGGKSRQAAASGANNEKGSGDGGRELRDYRLKDGETITVNLGGTKFGRRTASSSSESEGTRETGGSSSFSLPPPPSSADASKASLLPPPPKSQAGPRSWRRSGEFQKPTAKDLGFDDGQFGEFA